MAFRFNPFTLTLDLVGSSTGSNSFATIQPITGTSPTAVSATDTLTFASSSGNVGILGNSGTDTLDFSVNRFNQANEVYWYDDFCASNVTGETNWGVVSNAGADGTLVDGSHIGIIFLQKSSSVTGLGQVYKDTQYVFGGGATTYETLIQINNLTNAGALATFRVGFGDTYDGTDINNGLYFEYQDDGTGGTSPNWLIKSARGGVRTSVTSSTAVTAGNWIKLKITVNAAGTLATYFVNGVSIGTISTNIPTAGPNRTGPVYVIIGSVSNFNFKMFIDYSAYSKTLTTPR